MALRIKKKDTVVILTGKDRGKRGEVVRVFPEKDRALVSKLNLVKKHLRSRGEKPGGIQTLEAAIPLARLQLVCPKCSQPVRPKTQFLEDGSRVRLCRKCGEQIL
ncbi:MAG: 50S ribosomal protein L24 [Elusimicrobia bacterium]|nr:50S ribosomal protein L24 [Elusimicrobiota bacterium]